MDEAYEGDLYEVMERAGTAVALAVVRHGAAYASRVEVLAGPGNNGGDGYVAARILSRRGVAVTLRRLGEPRTEAAKRAADSAIAAGVRIADISKPVPCDVIVDAVFGGGGRHDLPPEVVAWMDTPAPVIAVDFPTGLDPDTGIAGQNVFRAAETVTFSSLKTGHVSEDGPDKCGKVTVVDIGLPAGRPSAFVAEEADALRPGRARRAHKWSAGAVLVVGGSSGMVGAAAMAARAALEFGAGTVYLASPDPDAAHAVAPQIPSLSIDAPPSLDKFDVVVAGPGLRSSELDRLRPFLAAPRLVLDAGALEPAMVEAARSNGSEVVVTPHAGEFKRLAGTGPGRFSTRSYAGRTGTVVVSKGNPTTVTDGSLPVLVRTGPSSLATIGTGDVLSGMIGALWARGAEPMEAAISGAYWHGVAAQASDDRTLTAERLLDHIGEWAW